MDKPEETLWARTKRKAGENPFVLPLVALTGVAVVRMASAMLRRDSIAFKAAGRQRVALQFMALAAIVGGAEYHRYKQSLKTQAELTHPNQQ